MSYINISYIIRMNAATIPESMKNTIILYETLTVIFFLYIAILICYLLTYVNNTFINVVALIPILIIMLASFSQYVRVYQIINSSVDPKDFGSAIYRGLLTAYAPYLNSFLLIIGISYLLCSLFIIYRIFSISKSSNNTQRINSMQVGAARRR